jgi:agmatine/peptidylarginine deiminase
MKHHLFPPEWFPQSAVQLTWVHEETDWDYILEEITACYIEIARTIVKRQKLIIVCKNPDMVRFCLGNDFPPDNLTLVEIASNDTWTRDYAPLSVFIDGQPVIYDFTFNGWGLKFPANLDNQINRKMFAAQVFSEKTVYRNMKNLVLEGGSLETDGQGTLLTTTACLLSPNRNPQFSKEEIEGALKTAFGLERVLWLDYGYLAGDDTDSHIDTLARFCDERTIAYVRCDNDDDEHFEPLRKMEEQLRSFVDFEGNPYRLLPLPMAEKTIFEGERLPATYANFLIINDAVLFPAYNTPKDEKAAEQLRLAFPDREIIGIDCSPVIKQHGSLHCLTMQYPAGFIN